MSTHILVTPDLEALGGRVRDYLDELPEAWCTPASWVPLEVSR